MADLSTDVRSIKGIGEQRAKALSKLGIATLWDLISWFPRRYEDRRAVRPIAELTSGETACVAAMIASPPTVSHIRRGLDLIKLRAVDETGALDVTFFNQTWLKNQLHLGETYIFCGKAEGGPHRRTMANPVVEPEGRREVTGRIVPVYPLTAGVSQLVLSRSIRQGLDACGPLLADALPEEIRREHRLCRVGYAYENIHFPTDEKALEVSRRRLAFEELFFFAVGLARLRGRREQVRVSPCRETDMAPFCRALPFSLTQAQLRCVTEALRDMTSGTPMNRLCQGDVGSGKTMVAAACVYFAVKNGRQAAMMAPTEILAQQHYAGLSPLLDWASAAPCSPAPPPPGPKRTSPPGWRPERSTLPSAPTLSSPAASRTRIWAWWSPTSSTASAWSSGRLWRPKAVIPTFWSCPPHPSPGPWP